MNITLEEHRRVVQGFQTELSIACRYICILNEQLECKEKLRLSDQEVFQELKHKISELEKQLKCFEPSQENKKNNKQ